jgi:NADP-dependent 3-hydroxy acid dehydrogenase YdfG
MGLRRLLIRLMVCATCIDVDMESMVLTRVVSNYDNVQQTMNAVVNDFGKIDTFIANAGMAISKPLLEQTLDEYRKQMSVNGASPKPIFYNQTGR